MLIAAVYRTLGRTASRLILAPVILAFYATGGAQRRASLDYLARVWRVLGRRGRPGHWQGLRHFFSFGESLIDKLAAWTGQIKRQDIANIDGGVFERLRRDPGGALILTAHFGVSDITRAMAAYSHGRRVNVVILTKHAQRYNAMLRRFAPDSQVALIDASEFGVGAAMGLSDAVARGEWVVMMGDRMPVSGVERGVTLDFLGAPARFPLGPFVLSSVLKCPTYMLACFKDGARYSVHFSLLSEGWRHGRQEREAGLRALVEAYARTLEQLIKQAPYQWFNFYDFWAQGAARPMQDKGSA